MISIIQVDVLYTMHSNTEKMQRIDSKMDIIINRLKLWEYYDIL